MVCLLYLLAVLVTIVIISFVVRIFKYIEANKFGNVSNKTLLWSEGIRTFGIHKNIGLLKHELLTPPLLFRNGPLCIVNCSDRTFPQDYTAFRVRRLLSQHQSLYVQNLDRSHLPDTSCKVIALPIGVNFHDLHNKDTSGTKRTHWKKQERSLKQLRASNVEKTCKVLVTWKSTSNSSKRHVKNGYKSRPQLWKEAMSNSDVFELGTGNRDHTWKMMRQYAFVYSPIGRGFDCFRTWEALALGCIVIAQPNPTIKEFVDRYPIILHNDPAKITQQDLQRWLHMYKPAKLEDLTIGTFLK